MPTAFDLSGIEELRSLSAVIRVLARVIDSYVERWLIVGATARELILRYVHKLPEGRRTVDLDIAIAAGTWQAFEAVEQRLVAEGAQHAPQPRHRFQLLGWTVDVLPFGGVEQDGVIVWPPDNDNAMSVVGFEEASLHAFEVILPAGERVLVASPPGLLILKLIAWRERHWDRLRVDSLLLRSEHWFKSDTHGRRTNRRISRSSSPTVATTKPATSGSIASYLMSTAASVSMWSVSLCRTDQRSNGNRSRITK